MPRNLKADGPQAVCRGREWPRRAGVWEHAGDRRVFRLSARWFPGGRRADRPAGVVFLLHMCWLALVCAPTEGRTLNLGPWGRRCNPLGCLTWEVGVRQGAALQLAAQWLQSSTHLWKLQSVIGFYTLGELQPRF